jgi:acetone carboxylase gamma subunit
MRVRITEYLDVDIEKERWCCNRCNHDLGSARESYKLACLLRERDPREVHTPIGPDLEFNFAPDPDWVRLIEIYCPGCGTQIENEYLPPGHPLTWDIQLDIDALKRKYADVGTKPETKAGAEA